MKLIQVAQRAVDLDRASAFYSRLLGSAPSGRFDPPGLLFFDLDGVRLLLDLGAPSSLIYLDVPDLRLSVEDLRASGTKIVQEPQLVYSHVDGSLGPVGSDEWMAFIKDSEGNTVGLVGRQTSGS
ncbi:glyoxalase/Bleomycin resistance protein/dioxygenase [Arthrobacter sp. Hiyo8]|uniref:VOC family protein n=1 Tax=Arthrobacter sp. Hiyo1 TaxID=1588020 RepID=UPI000683B232|nr:methylmalonyl-CoA epimerase [Arthrobacter sp. Hiyo1]BAS12181.1 glyoxalase/Bleomycin resistance protein/dioxygenase [Arthrobacter sp. Hiyo8]GAP61154.1 glyoxalase/Bleomycin resistance protein/dioxygenase [Arthrobacter sp. Hiyo1]